MNNINSYHSQKRELKIIFDHKLAKNRNYTASPHIIRQSRDDSLLTSILYLYLRKIGIDTFINSSLKLALGKIFYRYDIQFFHTDDKFIHESI